MSKSLVQRLFCKVLLVCTIARYATSWEFAVSTQSKIIFFDGQWGELFSTAHQFDQLSSFTFDESEEVVYFNDRAHSNGSIFSVKLSNINEEQHIIEKIVHRTKEESINAIAYDPINRNIYWSDSHNKKIYFVSTDAAETKKPSVLVDFSNEDTEPDGIAIDICRRVLFWTNSNYKNATIERIELDGSHRQTIVNSSLFMPHSIAVDQLTDRIYWIVDQQGVHFTVESSNFDGSDRRVIFRGQDITPLSIAITNDAIFWIDRAKNAVWTHPKFNASNQNQNVSEYADTTIHKVLSFADQPRDILAHSHYLNTLVNDAHCSGIVKKIKSRLLTPKPTRDPIDKRIAKLQREYCLNGGSFSDRSNVCVCTIGYSGSRCEISECHQYCVHGSCSMSSTGFPTCSCQRGFTGLRCQTHKCTDYCLNGGSCELDFNDNPKCECRTKFGGERCTQNTTEICSLFCRLKKYESHLYVPYGCYDICKELREQIENGVELYELPSYQDSEVCKTMPMWSSTVTIILVAGAVICLCLVLLIIHGLRRFYKPARPRIKKTFVVRKQASSNGSDTPLTNRPIAAEQCEITIENCCNMNICDTPCFDPKLVQQSLTRSDRHEKDDKKILIHSMEDELY